MRIVHGFLTAAMGCIFAGTAIAAQTVNPVKDAGGTSFSGGPSGSPWTATVPAGTQLVFFGQYSSGVANESGLGLKVTFDATKFTNVSVDNLRTKCMVASPQTTLNGAASTVVFGWADTSIRISAPSTPTGAVGWTGTADPAAPGANTNPWDHTNAAGCLNPGAIVTEQAAFGPPTNLFRFVATTAAGFTSGTSTIQIQATSFSNASGSGAFTNQSLVVTGAAAPLCNLDVDGSGTRQAFVDGVLIVRFMLGITGPNLIQGLTIPGPNNTSAGLTSTMQASSYDIDGSGSQQAFVDGVILVRLMLGIADNNLLNGVTIPQGAQFQTASAIRANVNAKCGTSF